MLKKRSEEFELKGERAGESGSSPTPRPLTVCFSVGHSFGFLPLEWQKNVSLSSVNNAFTFSWTDTENGGGTLLNCVGLRAAVTQCTTVYENKLQEDVKVNLAFFFFLH